MQKFHLRIFKVSSIDLNCAFSGSFSCESVLEEILTVLTQEVKTTNQTLRYKYFGGSLDRESLEEA